jgi:hypothetical protein
MLGERVRAVIATRGRSRRCTRRRYGTWNTVAIDVDVVPIRAARRRSCRRKCRQCQRRGSRWGWRRRRRGRWCSLSCLADDDVRLNVGPLVRHRSECRRVGLTDRRALGAQLRDVLAGGIPQAEKDRVACERPVLNETDTVLNLTRWDSRGGVLADTLDEDGGVIGSEHDGDGLIVIFDVAVSRSGRVEADVNVTSQCGGGWAGRAAARR